MRLRDIIHLALAESVLSPVFASESARPRGVGPDFAKYYKDSSFACIFNPSITIDLAQVNDDFCDCPDGSDEPGTSACSSLSPLSPPSVASDPNLNNTAALPGFYCKNKGHNPGYIPFAYVNDGVCDYELCCDGSDEWEGIGGVKCEDRCKELGVEWRKQNEARQKARSAAAKKRRELVVEASRLRKELEGKIADLKVLAEGDEKKVTDAEAALAETEKQESLRAIKAPKKGGKLGTLASLTRNRIDDLKTNLQKLKQMQYDTEFNVKELEGILAQFKDEYNPNFNDEGVKRAVRAWEGYEARGRQPAQDTEFVDKIDDLMKDESEHGINWDDFERDDDQTNTLYMLEEYLPSSMRIWIRERLSDLRKYLVENGVLAAVEETGEAESKAVQDARSRLDSARSERDTRKSELDRGEEDLGKDYGPDEVFRSLKGQCVEVESGEYKYEFCFMAQTTQKSQKGGMDTNMGNFERVETVIVDEELPADGKGLGSGERLALKYENGAHCWNGPARSTMVILACAEKNEIWKVVEAEKCVYRMEAGSPAACTEDAGSGKAPKGGKDEL